MPPRGVQSPPPFLTVVYHLACLEWRCNQQPLDAHRSQSRAPPAGLAPALMWRAEHGITSLVAQLITFSTEALSLSHPNWLLPGDEADDNRNHHSALSEFMSIAGGASCLFPSGPSRGLSCWFQAISFKQPALISFTSCAQSNSSPRLV